MNKETILDRAAKAIGDYLATYANKNVLNELCDKVEEIQKIKKNLEDTKKLVEKDDPKMASVLDTFIQQKDEQIHILMNSKISEMLPKPDIIYPEDYEKCESPFHNPYILRRKRNKKDDVAKNTTLCNVLYDIINDNSNSTVEVKKKSVETSSYYRPSGCGSMPVNSYGGCGYGGCGSRPSRSGGC